MDTAPDCFPSPSSSIILDEPDLSNSIYGDKIDVIMGNDPDREHPAPPTSEASMSIVLDSSQMPEDEDMMDEEPWTIVGPSVRTGSSASETTGPAPASIAPASIAPASLSGSVHNLTASNILRLDQLNDRSRPSVADPGSKPPPKRSHTRASDMSPPDLTEPFSPAAGHESAWGLCGVGAWADMASPIILAKKPGAAAPRH